MVKISELSNWAWIWWTEQVPVNDSWTTVKYTVDQILARTHNHTASQVTDFNTAVDARIDVLTDTAKTTPADTDVLALWDTVRKKVTRANIKATLMTYFDTLYHTKNALRTGLTATRLLSTNWIGTETYIAPGSAGQFLNHNFAFSTPTITPWIAILQTTRAMNAATWTVNIPHWLWVVPKYVIAIAKHNEWSVSSTYASAVIWSEWFSNFTTNWCSYSWMNGGWWTHRAVLSGNSNNLIYVRNTNSASWTNFQLQVANATADATNIILSRTYSVTSSTLTNNISITLFVYA